MREVDASLDLMRKDYKKRMEECESRRLQFEERQSKMREQVIKFEKFIQENDAKRLRAEAKAKHERQQFMEKCKELSALQQQLESLELSKEELCNELGG
jgi:ribosomal protein S20